MKLTFEQRDLMTAVNVVLKAVPVNTTMPILKCILIDASYSQITLTTNDMELGIKTIVNGTIIEKGKIALDAKVFSDIVRKLPDNLVTLETDDRYTATIRCEKSIFNIPGMAGDDFADLPAIERNAFVTLSQLSLKEMIRQTIFSIAINDNNKIMTGELLEIRGKRMKMVALDGHRIAIRNLELKTPCEDEKVIVPGKTLNEISKILSGESEDEVSIYFSENYLLFEFDRTLVLSRLIDGEYFRIDQMMSGDYETEVIVNRQEFMNCMDRAALLVRDSDKMPVVLDVTDNEMELSIHSSVGAMDEKIAVSKTGKDIMIGFNPKFILDVLRVVDDEGVSLYFVNPKAPCFIRDRDGKYEYLVLPVNINSGYR